VRGFESRRGYHQQAQRAPLLGRRLSFVMSDLVRGGLPVSCTSHFRGASVDICRFEMWTKSAGEGAGIHISPLPSGLSRAIVSTTPGRALLVV
jgi:hypothetical protein